MRSYCELKGIPVQQADESSNGFWSLRETQALIAWLRQRSSALIDAKTIRQWLETKPDGQPGAHWWSYLREAIAEYSLEVGEAELPLDHFLEWLAEWGREARRRQTGLLLLTAHKAKGLEFDHVAILDGDWMRTAADEDADAPRRLYYVAMTRARKTLVLARFDRGHVLADALPDSPALLRRPPTALPPPMPELANQYKRLGWGEINLDYSGTRSLADAIHRNIAALAVDDDLMLRQEKSGAWVLSNTQGAIVGKLSRAFAPPEGMHCIKARVAAIHVRRHKDVAEEHQARLSDQCESWELIVPELVFAPASTK